MTKSYIDDEVDGLSIDSEGVTDSPVHSKMALAALVPLVVGLLAPIESRLAFFSGLAGIMGAIVLIRSRKVLFSNLSIKLASVVLFLGCLLTVWAVTNTQMQQKELFDKATEIATKYMGILSNNHMMDAIQMVGMDPPVKDQDGKALEELSPSQRSVRTFLADPIIKSIVERGPGAKWESQGVINHKFGMNQHDFIVRFYDKSRSNQQPIDVILVMSPPTKYSPKQVDRWMVERVERPAN